jgi:hypothetical protein
MPDFDDEPRGRSATGAVVIAVIFLAILGTGVGIVLGSQARGDGDRNNAGDNSTPSATATAAPSASSTGGARPTNTKSPASAKSYRPTARDKCPQQTEEAAGRSLSVKRYVRTRSSEVWICAGGGQTVYQGHLNGKEFTGATTDFALFIGSVHYEAGVYAATNGDTTYFVAADTLRREKAGVEQSNEPVEDLNEG